MSPEFKELIMNIFIAPDRFAHYRFAVFNKIAERYTLDVYAPKQVDDRGIKIADPDSVNNKFTWYDVKSLFFRGVCYWQAGLIGSILFSKKYDMYIFWGDAWRISTWISAIVCRLFRRKVVFWTHGIYGNEGPLKLFYRSLFYKLADAVILYSQHGKEQLIKQGFDKNRLYVINNSLDFDDQDKIFNEYEWCKEPKKRVFKSIFVGRLEKNKKLEIALEAISFLNSSDLGFKVRFDIIGDGQERGRLEKLCSDLGLDDDVSFLGSCYDQKVLGPMVIESDICISPGNVGLTAMQSLAYGTPVISHSDASQQMPEFEAIKEGVSGALFENNSVMSLVGAIKRCVNYLNSGKVDVHTCRDVIKNNYTPEFQVNVLSRLVDDMFLESKE